MKEQLVVQLRRGSKTVNLNTQTNLKKNDENDERLEKSFNVSVCRNNFKESYDEKTQLIQQQFYSENKNISLQQVYEFIINQDKVRIINGSIYIYNEQFGYFEYVDVKNEGKEINKFIHELIRPKIRPKLITDVIKKLKDEPNIHIDSEEINSIKKLINCKNGVVDIDSGRLLCHNKEYLFTYCIKANFILDKERIKAVNFEEFVETSLEKDKEKRKLLLEIVGYLISSYNEGKKAFFFVGKPNSGKSLLSKLIAKLVGEREVSNISLHKLGDRFSIAEFANHKININAEISSSKISNLDIFKLIVGGDYLNAEHKGQSPFSFKCRTKLLFCGNYMPSLREVEVGDAFISRLIFLLFNVTTPEDKRNYNLENLLMEEIDSIFTLSVHELKNLLNRNFEFTRVKDSESFIAAYKNEQDHVSEYIKERCILGKDYRVHSKIIYDEYIKFCDENCIEAYNQNKFLAFLGNVPDIEKGRFRIEGKNSRGFNGITMKNNRYGTGTDIE